MEDSSSILFSLTYLPATNRLGVLILKAKDLKTSQEDDGKETIHKCLLISRNISYKESKK